MLRPLLADPNLKIVEAASKATAPAELEYGA